MLNANVCSVNSPRVFSTQNKLLIVSRFSSAALIRPADSDCILRCCVFEQFWWGSCSFTVFLRCCWCVFDSSAFQFSALQHISIEKCTVNRDIRAALFISASFELRGVVVNPRNVFIECWETCKKQNKATKKTVKGGLSVANCGKSYVNVQKIRFWCITVLLNRLKLLLEQLNEFSRKWFWITESWLGSVDSVDQCLSHLSLINITLTAVVCRNI